jgi:hypothetical protein
MGTSNRASNRALITERRLAFSRRKFLRGLGAYIALPALPSLVPGARLQAAEAAASAGAAATATAPVRMAFVTIPNGVHQGNWWPSGEGKEFTLGSTMEPLAGLKDQLQVISGLDHINATAGPDGAGDHARASASLLTGCRARKTSGADIHLGPSIDQVAAGQIGHLTRFPSLELTCDDVRNSGSCDSGYSCAYQFNVSWRSATTPMPPEPNPRLVFERLFGGGPASERREHARRRRIREQSVLDFVREDARALGSRLSRKDSRKLDEYLTSVREIEKRIEMGERFGDLPNPDMPTPEGIPDNFGERMLLMYDLLALAFQTDSTRIATLILAHDGSNRSFPDIGVSEGHHDLSHHQGREESIAKIGQIDKFYMSYFARFLEKLAAMEDVDGKSLLENSMIVYAGGHADGNAHSHTNLPVILAGKAGGKLQAGRFHKLSSMPMSNMYLDMLEHMGITGIDRFGDSTGDRAKI